jgi:hypothetical protein
MCVGVRLCVECISGNNSYCIMRVILSPSAPAFRRVLPLFKAFVTPFSSFTVPTTTTAPFLASVIILATAAASLLAFVGSLLAAAVVLALDAVGEVAGTMVCKCGCCGGCMCV